MLWGLPLAIVWEKGSELWECFREMRSQLETNLESRLIIMWL